MSDITARLRQQAAALGFDAIGFTTPDAIGEAGERLDTFLAAGHHGDMNWMADTADRRRHPRSLWPEVRTIILLGASYAPETDPLTALDDRSSAVISVYAKGRDYHDVLKTKLKKLASVLVQERGAKVKVFVDTAPLMEKPLAMAAGIGWLGKHTNLVSRAHGSWLLLGAILTTAEFAADPPADNRCGSCRRCLDICPTHAFPAPYQLDARRCLAYLSIEHKGQIGREFRRPMGNRVFGCDDCLAVCPWNKFAEVSRESRFAARIETDNPPLPDLLVLDDRAFRARFAGTPVKRTGRDRVVRNALVAAGNSGDTSLIPIVAQLLADASPLVRGMAVWALAELTDADHIADLATAHLAGETCESVHAEWQAAIAATRKTTEPP
ncbi:MAG: tRNA epoxyqueuosine(34) reductase QueG [Hyphomicrobium sp.]|nr:tRNA epoxyqueuosine(34) reductase QueG [Hyphomicrobium sp.]PPC82066.1 MAG: tRNA epoxyqueuosine(34) reductase QueG [Hyphomicrobium sp.]